jgi:hypothetical protein
MAWSSRKDATDVGTLTVNSIDLKAYFRDASETRTAAEIDVGAVNDTYRVVKAGRITGTLEVEVAAEGADLLTTASTLGTVVTFSHDLNLDTPVAGSALITGTSRRSGGVDGAQTQTFSLTIIA